MSWLRRAATVSVPILTAVFLAACVATPDEDPSGESEAALARRPEQAQMNDVSILYPLAKTKAEMAGYVSAADPGRGGALLPARLYTKATGEPLTRPSGPLPPGADHGVIYDELKAVAFRIDPCFGNLGPVTATTKCDNQLRIIFQPVRFEGSSAGTIDGAVHAFYSLPRAELVDVVKEIIALRRREAGDKQLGPLAVHPVLATQGLLGNEAKGLRQILVSHVGTSNLIRFTKFKPRNLATTWDFDGFDIAGGRATPMEIPTLPGKATNVSYFAGFAPDLAGGFTPPTTSDDDMQLLGNLEKARKATKTERQAAFDAALRIENPDKHSPNTIDCASCHVAGPGRVLTGEKLGLTAKGNPNAFAPNPAFVSAAEMKQTTPINEATNRNFHVFSYRDSHPMIAVRVINETASVVALVNGSLLGQ